MNISKEQFTKLAKEHLIALDGYKLDKDGNTKIEIFGIEKLYEAIDYAHSSLHLPKNTKQLSELVDKVYYREIEEVGFDTVEDSFKLGIEMGIEELMPKDKR